MFLIVQASTLLFVLMRLTVITASTRLLPPALAAANLHHGKQASTVNTVAVMAAVVAIIARAMIERLP